MNPAMRKTSCLWTLDSHRPSTTCGIDCGKTTSTVLDGPIWQLADVSFTKIILSATSCNLTKSSSANPILCRFVLDVVVSSITYNLSPHVYTLLSS